MVSLLNCHNLSIRDIVSNNVIALTVNSMRFEDFIISTSQFGSTPWLPDKGKKFLVLDVTVQNVGSDARYFAAGSLTVSDTNDFSYNVDSNYLFLDNKLDVASNIQPNKKVRGEVAFQLPIDATPKEVVYDDLLNKPIVIQLKN